MLPGSRGFTLGWLELVRIALFAIPSSTHQPLEREQTRFPTSLFPPRGRSLLLYRDYNTVRGIYWVVISTYILEHGDETDIFDGKDWEMSTEHFTP